MIIFRKLTYSNLISSGAAPTTIDLDTQASTLVIGANGAGKSTMLDALCFVLFGKPFRNITKPQLVNAINTRQMLVEIWFDIGNKSYHVLRGMKPNVFEIYCDGEMVKQDAAVKDYQDNFEKFVLKMNYKSFTQIVILGSASFTPFMQLSTPDRRHIIEELLDIRIFSSMNGILKEKSQILSTELTNHKYKLESTQEKIEVHEKYIANMRQDTTEKIDILQTNIDNEQATIHQRVEMLQELHLPIAEYEKQKALNFKLLGKMRKLESLQASLFTTLRNVRETKEFYVDHDDCPTCKQGISEIVKSSVIAERTEKELQLVAGIDELAVKHRTLKDKIDDNATNMLQGDLVKADYRRIMASNEASARYVTSITEEIKRTKSSTANVEEHLVILSDFQEQYRQTDEGIRKLIDEREYLIAAGVLLKDNGIKTKIVKQYIPVINSLVNQYLSTMGFFVNFTLDESFKETIKSRHRDDFTYSSFSEGEKTRIDMALMLTWRAIAKVRNSANANLLVLDEIFDSSLDNGGTEDLMKILNVLEATNLFIISHRGDLLQDKFANTLKFEKVNNFSRISSK
jgi:DNA repair exonuclease SbcCD ATPase subunit